MSEFDAVAYLASKGHRGKPASGGREVTYSCFFDCGEPPDSKKKKLYLSVADGFYQCKVCGASGGSYTLQQHFGDDPRAGTTDDAFLRRRILDQSAEVGVSILHNNDEVLLYLMNERGLSAETIAARKLGFVVGGWSLVDSIKGEYTRDQLKSTGLVHRDGVREGRDYFYRHLLIPYLSRGHVIQMRGRAWGETKGAKYLTGQGDPVRVYNADSLDGAEEAIITEGEFDTMILAQTLGGANEERARKVAVISVPGTNAIPEELVDLLADVKRVYIGFDSDDAGKRAAEDLKEKIGNKARILSLPYEDARKCDWTEYLLPSPIGHAKYDHPYAGHDATDVLRMMSQALGRRIFSIAEAGEAYRAFRNTHDGLVTGYHRLDESIRPGMLPGQVMVILAKTGTGKTLLLCNLAYQMSSVRVLFISLEMTREEIYDRLTRIYLFHHPLHNEAQAELHLSNIFICDENRLGERDLAALINEFIVESGEKPDVVMVDYLGYYARGAVGNSPYEKTANAIMQLKADAKMHRYVVITPSQVNRGAKEGKPIDLDDARDAGSVEETADFLLALYRPDEGLSTDALKNDGAQGEQDHSGKLRLSILKSRHGGRSNVMSLQMDNLSLSIVNDGSPEASRAMDHNRLAAGGATWESVRRADQRPRQMMMKGISHAPNT